MASDIDTIMKEVLDNIAQGAGSAYHITTDAQDLFKRRYQASFKARLDAGGIWEDEKSEPLNVANAHGVVAAAIARIHDTYAIDDRILMKAARLVEEECHTKLVARAIARGKPTTPPLLGQWCW